MIIETPEGDKYEVDTENKIFKKGDLLAQYQIGLKNYRTSVGYSIEPSWGVFELSSDRLGKFYQLVDKTFKVIKKV